MSGIKKLLMTIVGVTVFAVGKSSAAQAAIFVSTSSDKFGIVDPSTGLFTPVGRSRSFYDIAFSNEGTLFGITPSQLYRVDLSSGTSLLIGNLGISTMNALGFSSDNVLYGVSWKAGLYEINTLTGAASLVAYILGFVGGGDIVFDPVNNRFLATATNAQNTSLFSIEMTGAATKIGDIGFPLVAGLAFDKGTLFGYTDFGEQIVINPVTGKGTFSKKVVDDSGSHVRTWGAASEPSAGYPISSVPEPSSTLGLLAFGAFTAKMRMKRKRQQNPLESTGS